MVGGFWVDKHSIGPEQVGLAEAGATQERIAVGSQVQRVVRRCLALGNLHSLGKSNAQFERGSQEKTTNSPKTCAVGRPLQVLLGQAKV